MNAFIILNWNGSSDTIDCLKSLQKMSEEFFIVLVENGSSDDSVAQISNYLKNNWISHRIIKEGMVLESSPQDHEVIFYCLKENYGFAKGNNKGYELINDFDIEWIVLLNNDTVVEENFFANLLLFNHDHPSYKVLIPLIYYYYEPDLIWNAGGDFRWGFRFYNYNQRTNKDIKENKFIPCTFVTGCALMIKKSLISGGKILTEKYFHGEEDVDFCLRMKEKGIKMACVLDSVIYHKVNRATRGSNNLGKNYVHYLNRYINMKDHMSLFSYNFWKLIHTSLLFLHMVASGKWGLKNSMIFCSRLIKESGKKNSVSKEDFLKYLKNGI